MDCRQEMDVVTNGVILSKARNLSSMYGTGAKMLLRGSRKILHSSILLITDC
jgi:hypothetical protein